MKSLNVRAEKTRVRTLMAAMLLEFCTASDYKQSGTICLDK